MGAPWEEYQTATAAPADSGPWSEYAAPAAPAKPSQDLGLPKRPGGILQMVGEPIAQAMAPLVDPVNRGLVSLAGGITKGASKIGLIKEDDPIAQAGFDLTPQQLIETHGNQIKDMTGSPWAGAIAKKALEFGPASPGSWVVPAVLSQGAQGVTNAITNNARSNVTEALANQGKNATRDATIEKLKAEGYAIPPSLVGTKSTINEALESFAGKAATKQQAALKAAENTTALAKRGIGVPADQALTDDLLKGMLDKESKAYKDVAALSPVAKKALNDLQQTRFDAKEQWNYYNRSGNPEAGKQARALSAKAEELEALIDKEASTIVEQYGVRTSPAPMRNPPPSDIPQLETRAITTGKDVGGPAEARVMPSLEMEKIGETTAGDPNLLNNLRAARERMAKIHDVARALNESTGSVSAQHFGRDLRAGRPLTGELKTIGEFQRTFPQIAQDAEKIPAPGVSHVNSLTSAILGAGGYASMGPSGALLAAAPLARGPVRNLILSKPYQKLMVNPSYAGPVDRALAAVPPVQIDPMVAAILARGATSQNGEY